MTTPSLALEESQAFLRHWDQGGEPGRYETQKHLRAALDREAEALAERDEARSVFEAQGGMSAVYWRKIAEDATAERDAARAEVERLHYVLDGVAAAIDTGRNEPLTVWREQIRIAQEAAR